MKHPTKPNQVCRIVRSWATDDQGKPGPNQGKKVITVSLHAMQAADRVPVWRVRSLESALVTSMGTVTHELDCLNYWLEVLDEEPPQKMNHEETNKEEVTQ